MQVKDELRVLVEAEVARAIENFKKLSDGVDESEKKTISLGEALDSLSKKSLVISGVLGGAGIAAIKFAGENQKLQLSLKNMLGSAEEASVVFEEWRKLGASPGLNADEVFTLGKAMVNMGHETQYAADTIKMLGDIAAGTGVSFGELSGSFERARAMGNLTTRDLVRLQQQGIPIVKQLAKELNTSEENIKQMVAEGKIGFAEMERAFKSMTALGGQFAGMMDELSGGVLEKFSSAADDAKQALASFGELLLPMATEVLNGASSMLQGITNMDEGTKRFVLGMGSVVAVSGPAIAAIKGIGAAMAFVAANPFVLAIGGVITAAGLVAGIIHKQANAYEDLQNEIKKTDRAAKDILSAYSGGNDEKLLDEKTTRELIKLYPELSKVIKANNITVREAEEAQKAANAQRVISAEQNRMERLKREQDALRNILKEIEIAEAGYRRDLTAGNQRDADSVMKQMEHFYSERDNLVNKIFDLQSDINNALLNVGKSLNLNGTIIDIPIKVNVDAASINDIHPQLENLKKTWQEWFGEITNIDYTQIGTSGAKAAQLYIDEFERGLNAQKTIAQVLGDQLDVAGVLRSRQSEVQNVLVELLSIDPEKIDRPFTLIHTEIENLLEQYHRLGTKAKELEDSLLITDTIESLSKELKNVGKDQYDLALASMEAANATEVQMEEARRLVIALREARDASIDLNDELENILSFQGFLSNKISDGLLNVFPELEKQAAQALGNISAQLASISFDSMLNGLSAVGEFFAKGKDGADDFKQAMADMAQQILDQLPNMFLQAGLQLIAQGQWALGLGLIAAAGSSAIISGFVREKTDVTANAKGNAFDGGGIIPFASGGTFTNQIVNSPTFFKHGGKLGVMGEAGPESIMPLKRMSNGDLGVAASGGTANVTVNIINKTSADVHHEEYTDSEGNKQIDVIIGKLIDNHISSGKGDRAMTRFNLRPVGV